MVIMRVPRSYDVRNRVGLGIRGGVHVSKCELKSNNVQMKSQILDEHKTKQSQEEMAKCFDQTHRLRRSYALYLELY